MKLVANNVTVLEFKGTGHWLMEERPRETMDALLNFL
jgi:pimeloyl-ACP methyl ester carboxylesterase